MVSGLGAVEEFYQVELIRGSLVHIAMRAVSPGWYRRLVLDKNMLVEAGVEGFRSTHECAEYICVNSGFCIIKINGHEDSRELKDWSRPLTVSERSIMLVGLAEVLVQPNTLIPLIEEHSGV